MLQEMWTIGSGGEQTSNWDCSAESGTHFQPIAAICMCIWLESDGNDSDGDDADRYGVGHGDHSTRSS